MRAKIASSCIRAESEEQPPILLPPFYGHLVVQSRHLVVRIGHEASGFRNPAAEGELIWCEALEDLQPPAEVVSCVEIGEMPFKLGILVVVVALVGDVLDRSVHSLHLAVQTTHPANRALGLRPPQRDGAYPGMCLH